jgi:hypothetical protein
MSFIFHEGLAALDVSGVGWVSGDVMAGLAINYPPFWASLFTPPPVAAAPTSGGTLVSPITEDDPLPANRVYVAHAIPVTGRTIVDGKAYSNPIVWSNLPDTYGYDHWVGSGPGAASLWPEYWPLVRVYGVVITLLSTNILLVYRNDSGVTSIDLAGDPIAGVNHQDVTFNPNSLPWLQFAR